MASNQPPAIIARVLLVKDGRVALNKRDNNGHQYYAFPGGHVEAAESPEEAARREAKEELSVDVRLGSLRYILMSKKWGVQYFFSAQTDSNTKLELAAGSIEALKNAQGRDTYQPQWVSIEDLDDVNILPKVVAVRFKADLKNGFADQAQALDDESEETGADIE